MDDEAAVGAVLTPPALERFRQLCEVDGKIEPRYSGFTKHVLLSDDRAFLFPRNHTVVRLLERECEVYAAVDHPLVPALRGQWREAAISPYPFFAVTRLEGRSVDGASLGDMAPLAQQLGAAIAGYHADSEDNPDRLSQRIRKGATPGVSGNEHYTPIRFLGGVQRIADSVAAFLGAATPAAVVDALDAVEAMTPVLAHGDLHEGQLLVDESGALTGILDWGFAGVLSPLCDFTCSQFDGTLLAAEPTYGAIRRQMWTAYADRRAAELPTWESCVAELSETYQSVLAR